MVGYEQNSANYTKENVDRNYSPLLRFGLDDGLYGLGDERSLREFHFHNGIDMKAMVMDEPRWCGQNYAQCSQKCDEAQKKKAGGPSGMPCTVLNPDAPEWCRTLLNISPKAPFMAYEDAPKMVWDHET